MSKEKENFLVAVIVPSGALGDSLSYLQKQNFQIAEVRLLEEPGATKQVKQATADKPGISDWVRNFLHDAKARSPESAVRSSQVIGAAEYAGYISVQAQRALARLSAVGVTAHPRRGLVYLTAGRGGRRTFAASKRTPPAKAAKQEMKKPADEPVINPEQAANHAE